jgi:hypothetical protein
MCVEQTTAIANRGTAGVGDGPAHATMNVRPGVKSAVVFGHFFKFSTPSPNFVGNIRRITMGGRSKAAECGHPLCVSNAETRPENYTGRRRSAVVGRRFRYTRLT